MRQLLWAIFVAVMTATPSFAVPLEEGRPGLASFIAPLGMSTYSLLLATLLAGTFMKRNRTLLFPWHRRLAVATLMLATIHGLLVLLARLKS
jgi:hypothetical protein